MFLVNAYSQLEEAARETSYYVPQVPFANDVLRRKNKALCDMNAELEKKVLERTLELHRVNEMNAKIVAEAQAANLATNEARAMTERLYSIGTVAAGITHEINQPLNAIKLISSGSLLLFEEKKELSLTECLENLQEISRQSDVISNIISHLQSMIRKDESAIAPCDLNASARNALELVGKQLASHGVSVSTLLQVDLPSVAAVATGLEEVIVNLLVNGMQALDSMGKPDKRIAIRTFTDSGVWMEISDNGPGIDPSLGQKIFEPFFSTKGGGNNLGLGLAIVKSIVATYRGTIEAVSDSSGTAFRIKFPAIG